MKCAAQSLEIDFHSIDSTLKTETVQHFDWKGNPGRGGQLGNS
jgi:hypothetical protein